MSFRHGSNVEFEGPNFVATGGSGSMAGPAAADSKGSSGTDSGSGSGSVDMDLQERSDSMSSGGNRDFSNPMYEAAQLRIPPPDVAVPPSEASSKSGTGTSGSMSFTMEPPSAIIAPSKVTHATSPPQHVKHKELSPSGVDTGKDTQCLVEEDNSEC